MGVETKEAEIKIGFGKRTVYTARRLSNFFWDNPSKILFYVMLLIAIGRLSFNLELRAPFYIILIILGIVQFLKSENPLPEKIK